LIGHGTSTLPCCLGRSRPAVGGIDGARASDGLGRRCATLSAIGWHNQREPSNGTPD